MFCRQLAKQIIDFIFQRYADRHVRMAGRVLRPTSVRVLQPHLDLRVQRVSCMIGLVCVASVSLSVRVSFNRKSSCKWARRQHSLSHVCR